MPCFKGNEEQLKCRNVAVGKVFFKAPILGWGWGNNVYGVYQQNAEKNQGRGKACIVKHLRKGSYWKCRSHVKVWKREDTISSNELKLLKFQTA